MAFHPRPAEWEERRPTIQRTYIDEDRPLPEVRRALAEEGFQVTERQLKGKLSKWGYWKYLSRKEKNTFLLIEARRRREGKETDFRKYKKRVPSHTLRRYENELKRSGKGLDPDETSVSGVSYKTPSQGGGGDNHLPSAWRPVGARLPSPPAEQDLSHIGSSFPAYGPPQSALLEFEGRETALHVAIRHRHSEEVERLIRCGVSVNMMDQDDNTALHLAARQAEKDTVQLLLEQDASVD
ncbi:hypothetical protein GP486_007173, partial [Trichoglossum hirsutum]